MVGSKPRCGKYVPCVSQSIWSLKLIWWILLKMHWLFDLTFYYWCYIILLSKSQDLLMRTTIKAILWRFVFDDPSFCLDESEGYKTSEFILELILAVNLLCFLFLFDYFKFLLGYLESMAVIKISHFWFGSSFWSILLMALLTLNNKWVVLVLRI